MVSLVEKKKSNASATDYIKAKELSLSSHVRGSFEEKINFFFLNEGLKEILFYPFLQSVSVSKGGE